ncbi:MAG: BatD family protein, partial [Cocleimonas sp.]
MVMKKGSILGLGAIIKDKIVTFGMVVIMLLTMSNALAAVKASLEQATVYEGDPITLLIETSQNTNAKPDLSVLQKDFQVLATSTSSQVNVFNGERSFKKTWTVSLQ